MTPQNRRTFVKMALSIISLATMAAKSAAPSEKIKSNVLVNTSRNVEGLVVSAMETVRFGVVGVGRRGSMLLRLLLNVEGIEVNAICDISQDNIVRATKMVADKSLKQPVKYMDHETSYKDMFQKEEIDAVIIATPWRWHTPMAIDAMEAGIQTFVEVPASLTIDGCWQLVETSEKNQVNCMMLENVCYGREELMVLNMVREGLIGELTHGEAAYIHDLRRQMDDFGTKSRTGNWRTLWHTKRNANLYPTHGLGPIAQYMNINRGDRLDYLVSMSSPAIGRQLYAKKKYPKDDPRNEMKYIAGDLNSSLIKTIKGKSILLQYDTTTPRPYTRLNLIQGTNGAFAGYPNRIALESEGNYNEWDMEMEKWLDKYEHWLWKQLMHDAVKQGGHGGMDFVMLWHLVYCLRNGLPLTQNVYDAVTWSSIIELSERSVESRSSPVDFPDFTRGAWKHSAPVQITKQ